MTGFFQIANITRPADTTAYDANDVIGAATGSSAALLFASMGGNNQNIRISTVSLEIDDSALISGEAAYLLHLYSSTPPSAFGDNAAFNLGAVDRATYRGFISLGTPVDLGSTLFIEQPDVEKQLALVGTDLYGYLVTVGGYTPTSARNYRLKMYAVLV